MSSQFDSVAVVARRRGDNIVDSVLAVEATLASLGVSVIVEEDTAARLPPGSRTTIARDALEDQADLVVVVGGDGSLLGIARDLAGTDIPVVGVNRGGLGFLAGIAPDQIKQKLAEIVHGQFSIEEHFLLHAEVRRGSNTVGESTALNDVVVNPSGMARMMEFELWVDDEFVYDQRSDGVIIASPTGSTAYSLSAGGPIMHPGLDAFVIVPMFPHTLTSRPLVVKGDASVRIRISNVAKTKAQMSCDSQVNVPLEVGDEVLVRKYATPLKLLYPSGYNFFASCRSKLDWASRLGGQTRP